MWLAFSGQLSAFSSSLKADSLFLNGAKRLSLKHRKIKSIHILTHLFYCIILPHYFFPFNAHHPCLLFIPKQFNDGFSKDRWISWFYKITIYSVFQDLSNAPHFCSYYRFSHSHCLKKRCAKRLLEGGQGKNGHCLQYFRYIIS